MKFGRCSCLKNTDLRFGERVRCIYAPAQPSIVGHLGTVREVSRFANRMDVEFDDIEYRPTVVDYLYSTQQFEKL
jgi:hypothetical protein